MDVKGDKSSLNFLTKAS